LHLLRADETTRTLARLHLRGHCASHASGAPNVGIFRLVIGSQLEFLTLRKI